MNLKAVTVQQELPKEESVPLNRIKDWIFYVREDDDVKDLMESIKEHGLRREPLVTAKGKNYLVVSGHRRIHAVRNLGWSKISVRIVKGTNSELAVDAVIENLATKTYSPLEQARSYQICLKMMSARQLEKAIGKDHSRIVQAISLLKLDPIIQKMIQTKELTPSNAEELFKVPKKHQPRVANQIAGETEDTAREYVATWVGLSSKAKKTIEQSKITPSQVVRAFRVLGTGKLLEKAIAKHGAGRLSLDKVVPPQPKVEKEPKAKVPVIEFSTEDSIEAFVDISSSKEEVDAMHERINEAPPEERQILDGPTELEREGKGALLIPGLGEIQVIPQDELKDLIHVMHFACAKCHSAISLEKITCGTCKSPVKVVATYRKEDKEKVLEKLQQLCKAVDSS